MNSGRVVPQAGQPPAPCRNAARAPPPRNRPASRSACRRKPCARPCRAAAPWKHLEELRGRLVQRDQPILLCAIERMISMTCSLSFELSRWLAHRKGTRRARTMSRPMFRRLRSPPESVFLIALPTILSRRSLSELVSLPSMRRARPARECGDGSPRRAHVSAMVRWSSRRRPAGCNSRSA